MGGHVRWICKMTGDASGNIHSSNGSTLTEQMAYGGK